MGRLGREACNVHSISAQTSQDGIKCTKAKELSRSYCPNINTVATGLNPLWWQFGPLVCSEIWVPGNATQNQIDLADSMKDFYLDGWVSSSNLDKLIQLMTDSLFE